MAVGFPIVFHVVQFLKILKKERLCLILLTVLKNYFCRASERGGRGLAQTSADLDVMLGDLECITTRCPFFVTNPSLSTKTAVCRPILLFS